MVMFFSLHSGPSGLFIAGCAGIGYVIWLFYTTSKISLYLRGRGHPLATDLNDEIDVGAKFEKSIGRILLIGILLFGGCCYTVYQKFQPMLRKFAQEDTRRDAGSIRSGLSIYYGDQEGVYPTSIEELTLREKYITKIPKAKSLAAGHEDSSRVSYGIEVNDDAGWMYNNVAADPNFGTLWINCTHTDMKGNTWDSY
ncbi:MAG: hypothetical protein COB53_04745 [Elusimicrobia bacterium]|nr:MAG: hypothetical protein COB53_04745 [Elusimicrobiota bacterium]